MQKELIDMLKKVLVPDTIEQINALEDLGLTNKQFRLITDRVLSAYNQTTPNDAVVAGGQYAWLAAIRAMRDILKPYGWEPLYENHLEKTKNSETGLSLMVSSSCPNTGTQNGRDPKTKNPKGPQFQHAVSQPVQTYLRGYEEFEAKTFPKQDELDPVWVYLYHVDKKNKEIRTELSLPSAININGDKFNINKWQKRIILPVFQFDSPPPVGPKPEFTDEFDIEIKRRATK